MIDLQHIAARLMTTGITETEILENWEYRKGKTKSDLVNAQNKAKKNGMLKLEYEIDMCEVYLKDVLKKKKL